MALQVKQTALILWSWCYGVTQAPLHPATSTPSLIPSVSGSEKLYEVLNIQGKGADATSYLWQAYHSF